MPDPGPFGETRLLASDLAILAALWLKRPRGGWVESVFTLRTQRLPALRPLLEAFDDFDLARDRFILSPPANKA